MQTCIYIPRHMYADKVNNKLFHTTATIRPNTSIIAEICIQATQLSFIMILQPVCQ